jgi:hypothetical protein
MHGQRVCRMHGGMSPQARAKARQRLEVEAAEQAMHTYGLPRDVDPHVALLEEVHRTAGHVAWLALQVQTLTNDQVVYGITRTTQLPDGSRRVEAAAVVNTWVVLYQNERDRLRRVCADAIRSGVEERRVRLEEEAAVRLVEVIRHVLVDLGHDPTEERVRKVVRLRLTEGQEAA